jgi:lipopolysaccharide export system protein LptA
MPGPVTFTRGKMSGSGTGATYERSTGVFKLMADAVVVNTPDEQSGPVKATATTLTFTRENHAMLLEGQARIERQGDTLTADRSTIFMTDDEQQFKAIELRGQSKVTPQPGQKSNAADMQADDIDLAFYAGTQNLQTAVLNGRAVLVKPTDQGPQRIASPKLDMTTAPDGQTITSLKSATPVEVRLPKTTDAPERVITAGTLNAQGDDKKGLTSALFETNVRYVENIPAANGKAASTRVGTSRDLALSLDGQLDAITRAEFRETVKFVDGDVIGDGDLGTYEASKGKLYLRPAARAGRHLPHVTDNDLDVTADEIDLDVETDALDARGSVKSVSRNTGDTKSNSGLFSGDEPVRGFSDELHYDSATHLAKYIVKPGAADGATLRQGDSRVVGDTVVVNDDTKDLTATGRVQSTVLVASDSKANDKPAGRGQGASAAPSRGRATGAAPAGNSGLTPYRFTGDKMVYVDGKRTITYEGAPATMKTADGETNGREIVLWLAAESRQLDHFEAKGDVYARIEGEREALGETMLYVAANGEYTLTGRPVKLKGKKNQTDQKPASPGQLGCTLDTGRYVVISRDLGPSWPPDRNGGAGGQGTKDIDCKTPIK